MTPEAVPVWTSDGLALLRDGLSVGQLADEATATWVAEACDMQAEIDAAQAEYEASGEAPNCGMVEINGEQMRVQGGAEMPEELRAAMGDVVGAVKRRMAEEKAAERAEIEREIRAKVAGEIEAEYHRRDIAHGAYLHAAEIARGESR